MILFGSLRQALLDTGKLMPCSIWIMYPALSIGPTWPEWSNLNG